MSGRCASPGRCRSCAVHEAAAQFGLSPVSLEALRTLLARYARVQRVDVYGSRAMDRFRPGSDIDLALRGDALTEADLLAIEREIDDLDLPWKVDLALYDQIEDAALRDHIDRVGRAMYEASRT
ncbi:MAG: nucleotidyltransferase domain-containing protein [Variovorax sp.]